jgi:tetratricopeptide (TPR) repeat protein
VEAREVMADTQARIADIQSRVAEFDAALARLEKALNWVNEVSYFRGHLFETRGLVEQRRAEALAKQGLNAEAQAAKTRALSAFETAMQIQAEVIRQTPPEASASAPER